VANVFDAVADRARRVILDELSERDGRALFELCGRLTVRRGISSSRQAISQHLDAPEKAGPVECRREGGYAHLLIDLEPLGQRTERRRSPDATTDTWGSS